MGTNFYLQYIPSEKDYEEMQKALKNKELELLQEQIVKARRRYHIGKRSYGWAFLFQAKEIERTYWESDESLVPWDDNLDSLKEWLSNTTQYKIVNEYGTEFTPEQFWNEEVGESLKVHDKYMSHAEHDKLHPDRAIRDKNEIVKDNIRWCNCYFS